jgi:hypothetical protein
LFVYDAGVRSCLLAKTYPMDHTRARSDEMTNIVVGKGNSLPCADCLFGQEDEASPICSRFRAGKILH